MRLLFDKESLVNREKGHNVYFGGIADSGKTFVAKHILNVLNIVLACTIKLFLS